MAASRTATEEWLTLSLAISGSSPSCRAREKEKPMMSSKPPRGDDWLTLSINVSGGSSLHHHQAIRKNPMQSCCNAVGFQEPEKEGLPAMKRCEMLRSEGLNKNWLSLSIPSSSSSSSSSASYECKERIKNALIPFKKRKPMADAGKEEGGEEDCKKRMKKDINASIPFKKRKPMADAGKEEGEEEDHCKKRMKLQHHQNLMISPAAHDHRRVPLLVGKTVTESDANRGQHRLQLTRQDIKNSKQPLQELARLAHDDQGDGVDVIVEDRKGNKHRMKFKYVVTAHTYRFMGKGYTTFLDASGLKANQRMNIWGLPRGSNGEHQLAFHKYDA